ncbi:MAG: serine/threonine-protein kinase [Myxococcota bacterium]
MASTTSEELPRLGRYQVLSKLAQGGMAEIFLAKALGVMGFERLVAIKLIHSQLTRDQEFVKMFIDEARIAMHLQHRNIVQVFDLDKTGDTYFIAMEYVHGVNLYDVYERIASKGRWIDLPLAMYIVAEVCKGLHFAHTRLGPDGRPLGIVHRDISPQNVLLSFEGEVKITDFGIAKAAERLHHTTPGIVKGKYAYMAPEILKEKPVDGRADVFAAGVLLYELLVGENPYAGATPVVTIENVLNKRVPAPSARGAMVSRDLDEIVARALAKDVNERFRSAAELAEALTEHGLNLTSARRDIASGDSTVASLLAELFPEKLKRAATLARPGEVKLPMAEPSRDTMPEQSQTNPPEASTDPEQRESLDSTILNLEHAPKITRPTHYSADDEPSTALDLDAAALAAMPTGPHRPIDRPEVEPATDRSLPALSDVIDTVRPVVMSPEDRPPMRGGDEVGFDRTLLSAGNLREVLKAAPKAETQAPMPVPHAPIGLGGTNFTPSRSEQLVVPVGSRSQVALPGALGPGSFPPVVAQAPPANSGQTLRVVGIALAALAVIAVIAVVIVRGGSATLVEVPIVTVPEGAKVSINGDEQSNETPLVAILPAGKTHVIELKLRGYRPLRREVQPIGGVKARIEEKLEPVTGSVTLNLDPPDSTIFINGINKGAGLKVVEGLLVGQDLVFRIEHEGYGTKQQTVTLSEQSPNASVHATLEKAPK